MVLLILLQIASVAARVSSAKMQDARGTRGQFGSDGTLEVGDYPLEGLAENAEFLAALREPALETVHTQETSLENIFIRVTGRELT